MAIIDHDPAPATITDEELERMAGVRTSPHPPARGDRTEWSMPGQVLLAVLSAAAGVIHVAMVPSHASEWLPEGIAFAIAGWFQIAFAVVILLRPSRVALRVACLANVLFIGTWVVSRAWGLPVGPESGVAHAASFVDIACVLIEVAIVLVGCALLLKPNLGARMGSRSLVPLSVIPIAVLALATAAIASPSASGHARSSGSEAAGAAHDHTDGAGADGHDHGTGADMAADDKGLSLLMNGQGEGGGHTHDASVTELDAATQQRLDAQLAQTKVFMEKYPTVKDAEADGYARYGPFSPGLGAHYGKFTGGGVTVGPTMTDAAIAHPMLIYDGVDSDSELTGFMYNIFSLDTENPPDGFAGPNDHWHYHTNVCLVSRPGGGVDAPLGADTSAPKELCDQYGGNLIANTGYMVHVWTVPGWESPQGVFSNVNAKIACPNGTYYTVPLEEIGTRTNTCTDVPA